MIIIFILIVIWIARKYLFLSFKLFPIYEIDDKHTYNNLIILINFLKSLIVFTCYKYLKYSFYGDSVKFIQVHDK